MIGRRLQASEDEGGGRRPTHEDERRLYERSEYPDAREGVLALRCSAMTKVRSLLTPFLTVDHAIDGATLGASLLVADRLYVFHQFTLEALAFLGTWYVLRAIARFAARLS